jgi:hypothetical protein
VSQSAFTVLTPVLPGHDAALSDLLRSIGDAVVDDRQLGLSTLDRLHYASFSIVPGDEGPLLVFEGNVDGSPSAFLEQLLDTSTGGMDDVYNHCAGYPPLADGDREARLHYLLEHDIGADTFFVAWPGYSLALIRREDSLRRWIQDFLDRPEQASLRQEDPEKVHRAVAEAVRDDPSVRWALDAEPLPFYVRRPWTVLVLLAAPVLTGIVSVVVAAARQGPRRRPARLVLGTVGSAATGALVRLRAAELADDRRERARPTDWKTVYAAWSKNQGQFRHREDAKGQNHLSSIADIKPGFFRYATLRAVLFVIRAAATLSPVRGQLGGITSIHFARWVITPDRRLIFLSNFDGSWENYLGDFVDLAARGLTAVWTNTDNAVGFPHTTFLTGQGARDEARFKAFARYGMVPTLLWYSAYPGLTVANISNNRAIREGLRRPQDAGGYESWLRRL